MLFGVNWNMKHVMIVPDLGSLYAALLQINAMLQQKFAILIICTIIFQHYSNSTQNQLEPDKK